ncbi:MAG: hypothetical protein V1908_00495 [Candidatus Peregrinibacteria bacterium]
MTQIKELVPGEDRVTEAVAEAGREKDLKGLILAARDFLARAGQCEDALVGALKPTLAQLIEQLPAPLAGLFREKVPRWRREREALMCTVHSNDVFRVMSPTLGADLVLRSFASQLQRQLQAYIDAQSSDSRFKVSVHLDGERGFHLTLFS